MSKILTTTSSFNIDGNPALQDLISKGFEVIGNPFGRRLTEEEITALFIEHKPIGMVAGVEPLTRKALEAARPNLKVIARCGTGMDALDQKAAADFNMAVSNTPDAPSLAVAELTLGMILSVLRHIATADRAIRNGKWQALMGSTLNGKKLGLMGGGRIGMRVAKLAMAFGAEIIIHDPALKEVKSPMSLVSKNDLLAKSDILSLHLPYNKSLHHIIDTKALNSMKKGAILINAARGGLVDEDALADALKSEHIAGAALDVYENEPYEGILTTIDTALLTAHMGSYAKETRSNMEAEAAENLKNALKELNIEAIA